MKQPGDPQTVGVALESTFIRVARRDRGELLLTEHEWDPNAPERIVEVLLATFGSKRSIALSIGLGFLEIARPELPPLGSADLRRVLLRDADRYFPIDGSAAVAGPFDKGLSFATSGERLHRWVRAFEEWGAVRAVVAAPNAVANTLDGVTGLFVVDASADEYGVLDLANGVLRDARRFPASVGLGSVPGARMLKDNVLAFAPVNVTMVDSGGKSGAPAAFASAIGALKLMQAPLDSMLLDATLQTSLQLQRKRRQWISYALLAASILLLIASANSRRANTLRVTQQVVDSLSQLAAPGLASQKQLAQLDEESRVLSKQSQSTRDPLQVVAALSKSLPADAFVERIAWDGSEWRLDGSANQAASVVPHLDSAHAFTDVRVLTASTRFRDGARMRESFSVAFKLKGDSSGRR